MNMQSVAARAVRVPGTRVRRCERDGVRRTSRCSRSRGLRCSAACLVTGCSSGPATAGATCGSTHTAAGVPVVIKVAKGSVNCTTAIRVENEYAARIRDGQVPGNGGGAPVVVSGWTCQGYDTPEVLRTGNASQCRSGATPSWPSWRCRTRRRPPPRSSAARRNRLGRVVLAADGAGQAAHRVQAPGRADHLHLVPAARLGPVQGGVGGRHEFGVLALAAAVQRGHPDRHRDVHPLPAGRAGRDDAEAGDGGADPFGDPEGVDRPGLRQQQRELLAAEPAGQVVLAQHRRSACARSP